MANTDAALTVVTSLNPFSRVPVQLRCFRAWQELGVRIRTANIDDEADRLLALGLEETDILRLTPEETGLEQHGKSMPKIAASLHRLAALSDRNPVALLNSDLYPAMRTAGGLTFWFDHAPAMALTREECGAPDTYRFPDQTPYRGGLDAFLFTADALDRMLPLVDSCASAHRMSFGILGWDYVIGALIRSPAIGGALADSGMLLHERHPTTYSNLDEFVHYVPDMQRFAGIKTTDHNESAGTFYPVIGQDCDRHSPLTWQAKAMFHKTLSPDHRPDGTAASLADRLFRISPAQAWGIRRSAVAFQAARDIADGQCDLTRSRELFEIDPDPRRRLTQHLLAILFCLECRAAMPAPAALTEDGSPDMLNGETIRGLRDRNPHAPEVLALEIAVVFGSELVENGIFNQCIFDHLMRGCDTDNDRRLLAEIRSHIGNPDRAD